MIFVFHYCSLGMRPLFFHASYPKANNTYFFGESFEPCILIIFRPASVASVPAETKYAFSRYGGQKLINFLNK